MRASGIGVGVAEAEHVGVPADARDGRETRCVAPPLVAVEGVEQPAVEGGLERLVKAVEAKGVSDHEVRFDATSRGLFSRDRHGGLRYVDSDDVDTEGSDVQSVLPGPAPRVEDWTAKRAFARETDYRRLWSSDVPRRRAIAVGRVPRLSGVQLVTGWLSSAMRIVGSMVCLLRHVHSLVTRS
jgi:hypothetical protein